MKRPWFDADPSLLDRLKREVQSRFPTLQFFREPNGIYVRGSFPLLHESRVLERYSIEIELPLYDASDIPVIRETGGRIARIANNHVNEGSGNICLFVPEERWRVFPPGSTLLDFLNGPVRNYFLGFALKQLGEPWPFGERPHGRAGIIEVYAELIGTSDLQTIIRYIECLSRATLKGHWLCPCGSGKRIRNCHRLQINNLREKIAPPVAAKSLANLRSV